MTLRKLLDEIEFDYRTVDSEDGRKNIQLIDKTGVNLGKIESETFSDPADIIDRTGQYWEDYITSDAEKRLGLGADSAWEDIYRAAFMRNDPETDVLRSIVHPETVEIEDFKSAEDKMSRDESLIYEDLKALSNDEDSALPKFSRVKIYHPEKYGFLLDDEKIHVLAQYNGDEEEDAVFNQLNDNDFPSEYNGKEIDWNPVSTEQSGTIEQYLEHLAKNHEEIVKEQESFDVHKTIKETVEQTVNEKLGRPVKSAEDFKDTYNRLGAPEKAVFSVMTLGVADDVMGALGGKGIRLFEKDGQFVARGLSNGNEDFALAPDDVVQQAENIVSDRISSGGNEIDKASLARLRWFEDGFSFPKENALDESATERNFKKLSEKFPEITREQADIISDAMPDVSENVYVNDIGVFVEDITDGEPELNMVDLPTLAEYAAGSPSLAKEQQDILWSLVPNVNHKAEEKNMEKTSSNEFRVDKEAMDAMTAARLAGLADKAYSAYQLEWLKDRGISLTDIADSMDDMMNVDADGDPSAERLTAYEALQEVINDGIDGEMFASFEEFKDNEFLDKNIVKNLFSEKDFKEYTGYLPSLTGEKDIEEPVEVRRQDADDYINEMNPVAAGSVRNSLESLKAAPLDVYFTSEEDGKMNAYLVSRTDSGSYTTHLINENGLNWGHYDIETRWSAQKQAMARAAGTDLDNINLIEVESLKKKEPEISRDDVVAQVTWTRQDIVNAIENEKGPDYKVTDKDIDDALDELSPKYMEEKMIETGWDFINDAVTSSLSRNNELPLHDVFVADKERKIAVSLHPEYVFNEKTGENDLPNAGITVENTISGRRSSSDKIIPPSYLNEFQSNNGGIGLFTREIAAKEGITPEKIEKISADEFQEIKERRESVTPPEKQGAVEKLLRQTQAVLFKKGIENSSSDTDTIFKAAKGVLDTFSKEEKTDAKKFFKNFGDIEKTKAANEITALAHFIAESDPCDVLKKYPSVQKKTEKNIAKAGRERN